MSKRAAADGWSLAELEAAARPKKSRANVDPSAAAKILRHARDTAAKDAALDTLTKAACPEAADLIAAALRTGEATTRWKALKALNKIGETAVREHAKLILSQVTTLQDCPANKRSYFVKALTAAAALMGDAATPHLPIVLDLILKPHAPLEIDDRPQASAKARLKANLARQRHNEAAAAANDADDDDARVAVDVLAHCGVHAMAVVPALATACEGSDAAVREKARMALTSLSPMICGQDADILRTLLPNLASSAMHDDDESARNAAVYALGAALGALCDAEATTRKEAIALRAEFEPPLRALAEDAVESVRNAAKDELEDREW